MGRRVHPQKRSVSWVNSVLRQFLPNGFLFLSILPRDTNDQPTSTFSLSPSRARRRKRRSTLPAIQRSSLLVGIASNVHTTARTSLRIDGERNEKLTAKARGSNLRLTNHSFGLTVRFTDHFLSLSSLALEGEKRKIRSVEQESKRSKLRLLSSSSSFFFF